MLMMIATALVLGPLLFWSRTLPEGTEESDGPEKITVKATVDGKPVHSYIMMDTGKR